jgi:endonuclease-3 related protein
MTLLEIYQTLYDLYGHRGWWPADTTDEIVIGAILTQNVSWSNVEKAIASLRLNNLLSLADIYSSTASSIAKQIIPTRYYNRKLRNLKTSLSSFMIHFLAAMKKCFVMKQEI